MRVAICLFCTIFLVSFLASYTVVPAKKNHFKVASNTPLWDVLVKLGKVKTNQLKDPEELYYSADKGELLVRVGYATNEKGQRTSNITNNKLTCIACHSFQAEYSKLSTIDPQKRLLYSDSLKLGFLPGPTLFGLVNRVQFFNDDYQNKEVYKTKEQDLFQKGHNQVRTAIQACNQIFAGGRELKEWEVESILAYLWTLELKIGDLQISSKDLEDIERSIKTSRGNARSVNLLRAHYREVYPAHLLPPPPLKERKKISPILNNFTNGYRVYKHSCLYCHENKRFSKFRLDKKTTTFKFLKSHFDKDSKHSIYHALRYNPESKGSISKMPHYSQERMSRQQVQDLRYYIVQMVRLGDDAYEYFEGY